MNLHAERRERIAEFISRKRNTMAIEIFYAFQGTDYEASISTIRRDIDYLIDDKYYGITVQHGGLSGIYANKDWFYSMPITSKDILTLQKTLAYLPLDLKRNVEEVILHVQRVKENY